MSTLTINPSALYCMWYIWVFLLKDDITYELPGNAGEAKALQYFYVTPNTGELYVNRSLTEDKGRDTQYRVSSGCL